MPLNKGGKKVLYFITKGNFGGAQRYVYDLATGLPKTKFETAVAFGEGEELQKRLEAQGVRVINIDTLEREIELKKEWRTLKSLLKIIREEKPDIVHFNSSKIGFLGALAVFYLRMSYFLHMAAGDFKLKAIFTSHGWAFNEKDRSFLSRIIFYLAHYLTVLICDITIAVSRRTKEDIAWLPFIKNKIQVIYNGIEKFETLPKETAREFLARQEKEKIVIFSMSELHNNKGIDLALRALAMLPNDIKEKIIYIVAGSGEEKDNLEKIRSELHLENSVKFLGFLEEARKYLSGADIFLFPSRTENLPFAILEASLAALPIIATNVGGISEIISDMQDGILVHKENPKEITEAIKYLIQNPEKQTVFGKAVRNVVAKNFSKSKMLKETISVY